MLSNGHYLDCPYWRTLGDLFPEDCDCDDRDDERAHDLDDEEDDDE